MYRQRTLWDIDSAISSQESVVGPLLSILPESLSTCQPGPDPAPVSHSPRRASKRASGTSGTSGPCSSGSLRNASPNTSSASKSHPQKLSVLSLRLISLSRFKQGNLREQTSLLNGSLQAALSTITSDGSMEYSQTWKERVTPGGRSYWEHTASGRRTSGSESSGDLSGYPTAQAHDTQEQGKGRPLTDTGRVLCHNGDSHSLNLPGVAGLLSGYPTPVAQPANGTPEDFLRRKRESVVRGNAMGICLSDLNMVAQTLTGYPTPKTTEHQLQYSRGNPTLNGTVSGYSTPTAADCGRGGLPPRSTDTGIPLTQQVAGYNTPQARESCSEEFAQERISQSRGKPLSFEATLILTGHATPMCADNGDKVTAASKFGLIPQQRGLITPSDTTATERPGVLDAAFSRWLMGFPATWDSLSPDFEAWQEVQAAIARGD